MGPLKQINTVMNAIYSSRVIYFFCRAPPDHSHFIDKPAPLIFQMKQYIANKMADLVSFQER